MPSFSDFIGKAGGSAEQLFVWSVLNNILSTLMSPFLAAMQQAVNEADPNIPLTPGELANMVARNLMAQADAENVAKKSGIDSGPFVDMVKAAGSSPGIDVAITAFQRQLITMGDGDPTEPSLTGAFSDTGIRSSWWATMAELAVQIPSVAEVMNAWLEGQITEDEAHTRYLAAGGDPTWFQTSYNANGQAPTPSQALELLNRGIIVESGTGPASTSYEQAFLEGPWRNKWLVPFEALRYYYPPPRTVTAMFHAGQLTHDQAAYYLTAQGLDATLVAAYLSPSKATSTTAEKALSRTDIVSLYEDKLLTKAEAETHLQSLKYSAADAASILEIADLKTATAQLNEGISHIRTLYQAGKVTEQQAEHLLVGLEVPAAQAQQIINTWVLVNAVKVKLLTPAQVVDAWYYEITTGVDAMAYLENEGYDPLDAWTLLAIKGKGPTAKNLPPRPAA